MKEELYKYLSIGLLALLLLVCFGSLITYFVVGQESINNVAYASYYNFTYTNDNILDGLFFNNYTPTISSTLEDGKWCIIGNGSVEPRSNGLYINFIGEGYFLFGVSDSKVRPNTTFTISGAAYSGGYTSFALCNYNFSIANDYYNHGNFRNGTSLTNYFSFQGSSSSGVRGFGIHCSNSANAVISYIKLEYGSYFTGIPKDSFLPNGYDVGFTDGVNSVEPPVVSGVVDLTNVSWEVPENTTTASVSHQYNVTGSVGDFNFDILGMLDYGANLPIFDNDSSHSKPFILVDHNPLTQTITPYYIKPGDIITFTGGEDVTNTDLIQWLEDNNTFKSYQDGYQDGYNKGHDIGYEEGYEQGNSDTIVTLDSYLQPFGSSTFTGVINQDPTTFWWSVQPGMQPNTAVYGYLYFNISSLPIGSIVHFNFPFQKYIVKDNSNVEHEITDIRVLYDVDYYTNLLIAPRDSLPSIRLQQGVGTYSFNVIRPGDTIILYFPLNLVTDFNRYTFGLTWEGDEYNYSFTTSSISQDIKTQLDNAYERGLKDGNSQGYTNGYTVGYNEGADGAEHYTFNNLLGAVFDAPITMFLGKYNPTTKMREGGLFNFELLGVNLSGFVIAILSIGVVLFIMRLFIRGL